MKQTKKIIVANWKMNPQSEKESEAILKNVSTYLKTIKNTEVVVCPPYPFLSVFKKLKIKNIKLGAQDAYFEKEGSYTGEVSTSMLKDFKTDYVLVGHSERRKNGDTNEIINKKILNILKSKMIPIFCIGENDRDHNGFYLSFIKQQLVDGLMNVAKPQVKNIIIAYEPVWAIGSNATRVASVSEFVEIRIFIKKIISDMYGVNTANEVKIIYGGSVNPLNAQSFMTEGEADGLLVGRDSLTPKKFNQIISLVK